jgi:hypothetical protein
MLTFAIPSSATSTGYGPIAIVAFNERTTILGISRLASLPHNPWVNLNQKHSRNPRINTRTTTGLGLLRRITILLSHRRLLLPVEQLVLLALVAHLVLPVEAAEAAVPIHNRNRNRTLSLSLLPNLPRRTKALPRLVEIGAPTIPIQRYAVILHGVMADYSLPLRLFAYDLTSTCRQSIISASNGGDIVRANLKLVSG